MVRLVLSLILLLASLALPGADARAGAPGERHAPHPPIDAPAFPRSPRAAAVWASEDCWKFCAAACASDLGACLAHDPQGTCLALADRCDRACQRHCRARRTASSPSRFDAFCAAASRLRP